MGKKEREKAEKQMEKLAAAMQAKIHASSKNNGSASLSMTDKQNLQNLQNLLDNYALNNQLNSLLGLTPAQKQKIKNLSSKDIKNLVHHSDIFTNTNIKKEVNLPTQMSNVNSTQNARINKLLQDRESLQQNEVYKNVTEWLADSKRPSIKDLKPDRRIENPPDAENLETLIPKLLNIVDEESNNVKNLINELTETLKYQEDEAELYRTNLLREWVLVNDSDSEENLDDCRIP